MTLTLLYVHIGKDSMMDLHAFNVYILVDGMWQEWRADHLYAWLGADISISQIGCSLLTYSILSTVPHSASGSSSTLFSLQLIQVRQYTFFTKSGEPVDSSLLT
jgi:hypothetical protein